MNSTDWKKVRLADLAVINAKSISGKYHYDEIEYIDTSSVTENVFSPLQRLKLIEAPSRAKRIVQHGDTILSTVRPIQRHYGFIRNPKPNTIASTGFAVITPKNINPEFLFYYLSQESITDYLNGIAETSTTTFPAFRPEVLSNLEMLIPSDEKVQRRIAEILSSLDDKIELNRQTNITLEAIAQSIFKEWFIDFNFPGATGEMIESELGLIPKGWRVGKLEEVCKLYKGVSYKSSELQPSNSALVTLKSINRRGGFNINGFKEYIGGFKESQILLEGDLIFAQTDITQNAEVVGSPALVENPFGYKKLIASLDIVKCEPRNEMPSSVTLFYFLQRQEFKDYCLSHTNGSTVLHLRSSEVPNYEMTIPNISILENFDSLITPVRLKILENTKQNIILAELRDNLLPILMDGEIYV